MPSPHAIASLVDCKSRHCLKTSADYACISHYSLPASRSFYTTAFNSLTDLDSGLSSLSSFRFLQPSSTRAFPLFPPLSSLHMSRLPRGEQPCHVTNIHYMS
jgi:hypothetical protein